MDRSSRGTVRKEMKRKIKEYDKILSPLTNLELRCSFTASARNESIRYFLSIRYV